MRSLSLQLAKSTQLLLIHLGKLVVLGKRPESDEGATKELRLKLDLDLDLDLDNYGIY